MKKKRKSIKALLKIFYYSKPFLIMRITVFLLLFSVIQVTGENSYSQNTRLSLNLKDVSIENVLDEIENQSEFYFLFNQKLVNVDRKVDINAKNKQIKDILADLFVDENVNCMVLDRQILLSPEYMTKKVNVTKDRQPQEIVVTGKVTDENGQLLPGVTVVVKGTTQGTVTNADGEYSISSLPENATLVFSFVGMLSQEVEVGSQISINIEMAIDAVGIEEVVSIGYGTRVKGALTGSIAKANNTIFESRPISNTMEALQGQLPGVTITRGSGKPGGENYSLQIRGASSISQGKTFVLIDGVPGDLNLLNPNDIADVTVLKDAAASIYGARAADGVVLITTKKGQKGATSIAYSGNYGIKTPQFLKKKTNTLQLAEMYNEGMTNVGLLGVSQEIFDKIRANADPDPSGWLKYLENFPGFYRSHDWIDDIYGNAIQQSHNLTISGGGDNNTYLLSAGYERDEGVFNFGENYSERYNLRLNYDFRLFDRLKITTGTSFESKGNVEPSGLDGILWMVNQMPSYVPIYNPLGQFYKYQGGFRNSAQHLEESGSRKLNNYRLSTNVKGELELLTDLKVIGQVGINIDFLDDKKTNPSFNEYNWDGSVFGVFNDPNSAYYINSKNIYKIFTGYLDYSKTLSNKHRLNVMLGASHEENDYQREAIMGYNFASNEILTLNLADKTKTEYANFTGSVSDWALRSYFGRFSYSFENKYFIDFTTRIDGSSKFASDKRWSALFPSVGVSWKLSEEDFIKSLNAFDHLKLRASWGQSGNQEISQFGYYDYISLITISGTYPLGSPNVGLPGAVPNIASAERTWETIETQNVGIDFSTFQSRLTASFDYYIKHNKNMLVNDQLPATLGGNAPTQNIGKLETKGWDFSIGWSDEIGEFKYSISGIVSDSKNKLIELKGNDSYGEGLIYAREGYALNSYFGYQYDGIISNSDQLNEYKKMGNIPYNLDLGDVIYKDVDGDGKITAFGDAEKGTKGDLVYLGNLLPRYTFSSNINISYKRFDLSILLQGVGKRNGIRTGRFMYPFQVVWVQPLEYFYGKTWTPDNTDAEYPRIIPGYVGFGELADWNWRYSNMRMNNLAYLKVKVLSLAYNVPQSFCSKLKMQSARVYVSGQDLFTFSKDTWNKTFSPEEVWERSDSRTYPFSRVISLGVDIKF